MNIAKIAGNPALEVRAAWIAGVVVAAVTVFGILTGLLPKWAILDVLITLGLAFGIYRRSRVCAVLMLGYFIANRVLAVSTFHRPPGIEAFFLAVAFIFGVHGTVDFHRNLEQARFREQTGTSPDILP